MRAYSMNDALSRHPEIQSPTLTIRHLADRFRPAPPESVRSLLITMGPFLPNADAFPFSNTRFEVTADQATDFLEFVRDELIDAAIAAAVAPYKSFLSALEIPVPGAPNIPLPDIIFNEVINKVIVEATTRLVFAVKNPTGSGFGRCGGMSFGGYDFYLQGWRVDSFVATPASDSELGEYLYDRLLDSLKQDIRTFLEWFLVLHVLPEVDEIATATLLATGGSFAFPVGPFIGALIGSKVDIFDIGGASALLKRTLDEWPLLKKRLDDEAACPIGLLFDHKTNLWDQHQVLAIGYTDSGLGTATLSIWDNKDGANGETLELDFRGDELTVRVTGFKNDDNDRIKGFFHQDYARRRPPLSLKVA